MIVHRLEQLSHVVLKNEWPGRRHHHHPAVMEGMYDDADSPGPRGGLEHNYAGGMSMGRKRAAPELVSLSNVLGVCCISMPIVHSAVVDKRFVDKIGDKTAILRKYDMSTKILFC